MFKSADPSSRIPAVLQANTKENIIFQITLAAVFVGGMMAKDALEYRREMKRLEQAKTEA
jgi:hypothetical protein